MSLFRLGRTSAAAMPAAEGGRGCPHCKESLRRDARVCPHCRNESEPWIYRTDRWWIRDRERGVWLWLDEGRGEWVAHYYATPPASVGGVEIGSTAQASS
jgi:hypothetical protein